MNIPAHQIEALTAFGYTVSEARFLYIVALHSGYFMARQFLASVNAKRGYRTHSLAQKLITQGHATMREYRRNGCIYHLYSRKLYAQLGHENLRNRRRHRLEAIRTRLLFSISSLPTRDISTSKRKPKRSRISTINCTLKKSTCR